MYTLSICLSSGGIFYLAIFGGFLQDRPFFTGNWSLLSLVVSVGFSAIGSLQSEASVRILLVLMSRIIDTHVLPQLDWVMVHQISLPAAYSQYVEYMRWGVIRSPHRSIDFSFILSAASISASRLMLSSQALAEKLHIPDVQFLLSTAELSRVRWRRGSHDGELIVDVDAVEFPGQDAVYDIALENSRVGTPEHLESLCSGLSSPRVYTTVVGQYDDLALGCPGIRMPPS